VFPFPMDAAPTRIAKNSHINWHGTLRHWELHEVDWPLLSLSYLNSDPPFYYTLLLLPLYFLAWILCTVRMK